MIPPIAAWYSRNRAITSSGSELSEKPVKPRRSQNRAVISRRWLSSCFSIPDATIKSATCWGMPTAASLSIQFSVQWAHALCSARASSDLAFVGEWLARHCKANLRCELRSSRGRQYPIYRWTAAVRFLQDYSRDCRLAGGNRIGSDAARPSLLDWTVGSGYLDGWRPVFEFFEAPVPPRAQQ